MSNQDDLSKMNIIDHDKHLINPFGKLYDLGEILFIIDGCVTVIIMIILYRGIFFLMYI